MRRAIGISLAVLLVLAPVAVAVELDGRFKGSKRHGRLHVDVKEREHGRDKLKEFEAERLRFDCPGRRHIRRTPPAFRNHRLRRSGRIRRNRTRVVESTGDVTYRGWLRGRFSKDARRGHGRVVYTLQIGTTVCDFRHKWRITSVE